MEHYEKGEVVKMDDLHDPFIHMGVRFGDVTTMKVRNGTKIRNLLGFAMEKMKEDETRSIIFSGMGLAITKTVTCVEIMKQDFQNLHQINKAYFRRTEEYWEPKEDGLDRLQVTKQVPALAVLLSKDPLDKNELGYQAPGSFEAKWIADAKQEKKRKNQSQTITDGDKQKKLNISTENEKEESQGSMGMRKKTKRGQRVQYERTDKEERTGGKGGKGRGNRQSGPSEANSSHMTVKSANASKRLSPKPAE